MANFPNIVPNAYTWGWRDNTQVFASELNNSIQTASMPGGQWYGNLSFNNRDTIIDDIATFKAFLMSLKGQAGRFRLSPPDLNQRGTMLGAGRVAAGSASDSIDTKGWTPNQPKLFKAGDYIEVNGELKMILEDATSNPAGNATLKIAPKMHRKALVDSVIEVQNPTAECMLENSDQVQWQVNTGPSIHNLSISVIEDVT